MNRISCSPILLAAFAAAVHANSLAPIIGTTFTGLTYNQVPGLVPSDMGMAVGQNQIVQVINGGYEVFTKSGASLTGVASDLSFWHNAGIADTTGGGGNPTVFDPRVVYDPGSQRFFVTEENFGTNTSNNVYLAVSKTANALDGFNGLGLVGATGFTNGFADFPTLGLDKNGVYIGTNNFNNDPTGTQSSVSIFSIPKADLLLAAPTVANGVVFAGLDVNAYGYVPNAVLDSGGTHGAILGLGPNLGQATLSYLSNTGTNSPSLSAPTGINGLTDGAAVAPIQADGSQVTTDIDDRFSSTSMAVGNLLYATNSIGDGAHDLIHWMILDLATQLVLQQGTFSDPNFDYTYPSIAANANGDFVIGFNRSGSTNDPSNFLSAYATLCHYDGTAAACGAPVLLKQGLANTADGRWGDYSVTTVDPTNSNIFWTAIEVPGADANWTTQITELIVPSPEPATFFIIGGGLVLLARLARLSKSN